MSRRNIDDTEGNKPFVDVIRTNEFRQQSLHINDLQQRLRLVESRLPDFEQLTRTTVAGISANPSSHTHTMNQITDLLHSNIAGLDIDDHTQYLLIDGSRSQDYINFVHDSSISSPVEGDVWWNPNDSTLNLQTHTEMVIQVGQEQHVRVKNESGIEIPNGAAVYLVGTSAEKLPSVALAKADRIDTVITPIGLATVTIADGATGQVTTFGAVRNLDTTTLDEGERVYISATTAGELTSTAPVHPDIRYEIGFCGYSHASDGYIGVTLNDLDVASFYNGTMREQFDAQLSSDGATITMSLERSGGGDLTMRFSDGYTVLDCTPAQTIALTAGTDTVPQENYIYIPKTTKVLTKSTSDWPTTEAIRVGYFLVQTAGQVQDEGELVNQNWNDADAGSNAQGHMPHIGERIRHSGCLYHSGVAGAGVDDYLTLGAGTSYFKSEGGVVFQMHRHTFPAFDQSTGDKVYIVNDPVTAYLESSNLFDDITTDSTGTTINNNRYFNLIFWGVGNKTGSYEPIMCNLPSGFYVLESDALVDSDGYDDFSIPREFDIESSTGFLIVRMTIQMGATWDYIASTDLRGLNPQTARGGVSAGVTTSFNDSTFDVHNITDSSKVLQFDVSLVNTGTTRTLTIADVSGIIITDNNPEDLDHDQLTNFTDTEHFTMLDEDDMASDSDTQAATQQSIVQYVADEIAGIGAGEINTGSNQGTDGVGVYDTKVGVDLQFRHIAPASSKVTVVLNSKDIDIDVVEANLSHDDLADTHNLTTDIDHDTITNNHNLTTDIDHDALTNTHNLTTDIDHNTLINTHNLTTDIYHNNLTNTHNLTTDIDHDQLTNYAANEHFLVGSISHTAIDDIGTNAHSVIDTHLAATDPHSGHVDTTGNETIAGVKTFSSFPVTPSLAPTTDYQVANKKYVDDEVLGAGDNLGDHTATEDLNLAGFDLEGVVEIRGSPDADHRIVLDPVADHMSFYPGDDASDNFWYMASSDASADYPLLYGGGHEEGQVGIQSNYLADVWTVNLNGVAVDDALHNPSVTMSPLLSNGASWGAFFGQPVIEMPASDNDCSFSVNIRIPDHFAGTNMDLNILWANDGTTVYEGKWSVTGLEAGDNWLTEGRNVLNEANGVGYDFPSGGTQYVLQTHTISLTDGNLVAGGTLGVKFVSDASNANKMWILEIWIEE